MRNGIADFSLPNLMYRGAEVAFYTVSGGAKTDTLATLYMSQTGDETLKNPQFLDKDGQFVQPVYVDTSVVAVVGEVGANAGTSFPVEEVATPQSYVTDYNPQLTYVKGDSVILVDGDGAHQYWNTGIFDSEFPGEWSSVYVAPTVYATWDTLSPGLVGMLSNGNLTVTKEGGVAADGAYGNSTVSVSTGKWYWEITRNGIEGEWANSPNTTTGILYGLSNMSAGWQNLDTFYTTPPLTLYHETGMTAGTVLGVAIDCDAGTAMFFLNGVNVSGDGNFACNIGEAFGTDVFAAVSIAQYDSLTANFGASAFAYSVPDGYNAGLYTE